MGRDETEINKKIKNIGDIEYPYSSGLCDVCLNFIEKDSACLMRVNWGDYAGQINEEQPYILCSCVNKCRRGEYQLNYPKIFEILKEYKELKKDV